MAMKSKYTDIDLSKYDAGFQGTDATRRAEQQKVNAENAVTNLGDFSYIKQDLYDQAMNASLNREKFSYDLNGDALYQQYKDNYITQGKQAMMDTMGQAAAMTGGYGNSYAATVGNQTYQGHLQNLNNIVPELYQMALDRYNAEGDRLAQNFAMLSADRETERADYDAKLNRLLTDRAYYSDNYNNVYNQAYTGWNDQRTYDTNQYWNEHNAGYTAEQDAKDHELALAQFEEQKRAQAVAEQLQREQIAASRSSGERAVFGGFSEKEFVDAMKLAAEEGDVNYAKSLVYGAGESNAAWEVYHTYFGDEENEGQKQNTVSPTITNVSNGVYTGHKSWDGVSFTYDPKTGTWK